MKHISQESIDKAIGVIDNLDDTQLEKVFEKYALAQQTLLAYLMSAPTEYENDKLEGLLVYYFCLINECCHQQDLKINEIYENQWKSMQINKIAFRCRFGTVSVRIGSFWVDFRNHATMARQISRCIDPAPQAHPQPCNNGARHVQKAWKHDETVIDPLKRPSQ